MWQFLRFYSDFDFENVCITVRGPISLTAIRQHRWDQYEELIRRDAQKLSSQDNEPLLTEQFLRDCVARYSAKRPAPTPAPVDNESTTAHPNPNPALGLGGVTASPAHVAVSPSPSAIASVPLLPLAVSMNGAPQQPLNPSHTTNLNGAQRTFATKYLNIMDPLDPANNLGRGYCSLTLCLSPSLRPSDSFSLAVSSFLSSLCVCVCPLIV